MLDVNKLFNHFGFCQQVIIAPANVHLLKYAQTQVCLCGCSVWFVSYIVREGKKFSIIVVTSLIKENKEYYLYWIT